jgi:transposase-like protein
MKDKNPPKPKDPAVEKVKDFINKYRQSNARFKDVNPEVLLHLAALKKITSQPKQDKPDESFKEINQHLGPAESSETLRQERWHGKVHCPYCNSKHIKLLAKQHKTSKDDHKYKCLECHETFNDDSETKIEVGVPPLQSWMLCWYLLGCTSSLQYIANKLGLSITIIEMMINHMQKLFKAEQPLTHMLSFEEWAAQHGIKYQPVLEAEIVKQTELYRGETTGVAKDTHEYRRQKERAMGNNSAIKDHPNNKHKPRPIS